MLTNGIGRRLSAVTTTPENCTRPSYLFWAYENEATTMKINTSRIFFKVKTGIRVQKYRIMLS
jgi:hypothetical protein